MRIQVQSLPSLSGLWIRCCCKLWCRSQTQLRSGVAMAVVQASSYSSNWTPSLGTSISCKYGPKRTKKQTNKQKNTCNMQRTRTDTMLSIIMSHFNTSHTPQEAGNPITHQPKLLLERGPANLMCIRKNILKNKLNYQNKNAGRSFKKKERGKKKKKTTPAP